MPCRYADGVTGLAQKLLEDALALPQDDREELLSALSGSLDPVRLSTAWEAEIGSRLAAAEAGRAVILDADESLGKLTV